MIIRLILLALLLPTLASAGQGMGPGPGFKTYSAGAANECVGYSTSCSSLGTPTGTVANVTSDRTTVTDWTATKSGTAKKIHLYIDSITDGDGAVFYVALYKQTGGSGDFVLQTSKTYTPATGWNAVDISAANITFASGDVLYFGQATDETATIDINFGRDASATTRYWYKNSSLPGTFGSATSGLFVLGAVLEFTP